MKELLDIIAKLNEKCHSLELENVKLKTENDEMNKFCEHLIFEVDFLKTLTTKVPVPIEQPKSVFELDHLLNDYEINKNEATLIELFNRFPEKQKSVLTAIRESLPENIEDLAKIYHFEEDLKLLIKSNEHIRELEKSDKRFEKSGPHELVDKYIRNFNSNSKSAAYRYLRQALLCYPLTYKEQFIDKIQAYLFDDFDERFTEIFEELYVNKPVKKPRIPKEKTKKSSHINYAIEPIGDLIKMTRSKSPRLKETAIRVVKGLKFNKRSEAEINQYITGVNNFLKKKL